MSLVQIDTERLRNQVASKGLTQKELAERSGVSRSQIVRLLKESGRARVRAATAEGLASALDVSASDFGDGDEVTEYRRVVAEEFSRICFRGLGMPWALEQELEELFVDPRVSELPADPCMQDESRRSGGGQAVQRAQAPSDTGAIRATDCVRLRDRVVLLGHPGCGKTTILKYLAHSVAVDASRKSSIPIYVRIPELAHHLESDPEIDPLTYIGAWAATRDCRIAEDALRGQLESRRLSCLILLDGLDEIGDGDLRELVIATIVRFVRTYPRNRYVIASRQSGYNHETWKHLGFAAYRIEDYEREEQAELLAKWSPILARVNSAKVEETLDGLAKAVFSNPRVKTLAANPLILTICILLHQARGGSLPRRRVDLYEKIADVFLDTWESSKEDANSLHESRSVPLDSREFLWLLSRLALAMQKAGRVLVPRWWVASQIRAYLLGTLGLQEIEAEKASDGIIRYLSERTGLLAEQGADVFAFSHRTVQEHFAALGVIDEAGESESRTVGDCLADYFYHPDWPEVVRLVAARLTPATAESFIRRILDDPDPAGRFLRRAPLLALACLSDGTNLASRLLTEELFQSLTSLGESRWLGLTMETLDLLDRLRGTRFEADAQKAADAILGTARQALTPEEFQYLHIQQNHARLLEMARGELNAELSGWAMQAVTVRLDDIEHHFVFFNLALREADAETWFQSASRMLADDRLDEGLRTSLVREMGRYAQFDSRARNRLKELATSDLSPSRRSVCIRALPRDGTTHAFFRRLLRDQGQDAVVRAACAAALEEAAAKHKSVANELMGLLDRKTPEAVREGAARGLEGVVVECVEIRGLLLQTARSPSEPESLRMACAWSLATAIGTAPDVTKAFLEWLSNGSPAILQRIAAQALALAMAEDRLEWNREIVQDVEGILMQLSIPCPEALHSLEALVSARETRRAYRLETILGQTLEPLVAQIELAFVFGSVARNRQGTDSDIDLFALGSVSLKELSGPLSEAERSLGRQVNPVIYSRESFCQKFQAGDPFLLDVYRREKIPILGPGESPTVQEVNHELRAMAAERLAAAE
jgi:transcriptional regulator with XRE-family HTH domain/predicted nucleotidyltransferase/energy-coupling factor transporter ATP-binding protein EcfA2